MTPDNPNDLLQSRAWAVTLPFLKAIQARTLAAAPGVWAARGAGRSAGDIAVVPVMGLLTQRGSWYGMSIEGVRANLRNALADGSRAVVLEFDSPGGEVYGVDELATEIRQARGTKPIVASVNSLSASASYYLAAQADEILVTPSGEIGSVGVYAMHEDWSRALDQMGITVSFITAGEGKTDGNMFEALSDEVRAEMQADIDRYYGMFVAAVAKGRRVSVETIRAGWKAKVYGAKDAVAIGMATGVGTIEDAIRRAGALAQDRKAVTASVDVEVAVRQRARARNEIAN